MKLMMVGVEMSRSRYRHAAAASRSYIVCLHLTFIDLMLVLKNCLLYYTFVVFCGCSGTDRSRHALDGVVLPFDLVSRCCIKRTKKYIKRKKYKKVCLYIYI